METQEFDIESLNFHRYIDKNPIPTPAQYDALYESIEQAGQLVPIWINRKTNGEEVVYEVFDGRHRTKVLRELGREKVLALVYDNLSDKEVLQKIEGSEMRRHDSASQLAIKAWYDYIDPNSDIKTMIEAAKKHGASVANVKRANKIGSPNVPGSKRKYYARRDILDLIYAGGSFRTSDRTTTTSLATIENWLAQNSIIPPDDSKDIKIRDELTEDEEDIVDGYYQAIIRESELVKKTLVNKLYVHLKGE